MLIDYVLIYMNINILGNITNHLIYHQSREHLGTKKRPIVLHTQFGFRDQMCYSFHMSQPTKCIFNGKFLQSKICTVAWVVCQKAKFALNFISVMLLHVLGGPQRSQKEWKHQTQTIMSLFGHSTNF